MHLTMTLAALLFLPLFPFSMLFVRALLSVPTPVRLLLLLAWPQLGVALAAAAGTVPGWLTYWVLLTSVLYAGRALVLRELNLWIAFLAVSSWSLLWLAQIHGSASATLHLYALGMSLPMVVLGLLAALLQRQFGAAYAGLPGGLAARLPRLSAVLVVTVLALVATPPSPAFAAMLGVLAGLMPGGPGAAVTVGLIWLLWTWAAARLLQGLIVGEAGDDYEVVDLGGASSWGYGLGMLALAAGGVYLIGGLA